MELQSYQTEVNENEMVCDNDGVPEDDEIPFPYMELPQEIRADIINRLSQKDLTALRLACKELKKDVDSLYDFKFNIYDTCTERFNLIRSLRVKDCTIWKLTVRQDQLANNNNHDENNDQLNRTDILLNPQALKILRVYGPVSAVNLHNLLSNSINLTHIVFSSRANYPWMLNSLDTPNIKLLKHLSSLRLTLEYHDSGRIKLRNRSPPFMDFTFPALTHFHMDINRCPQSHSHFFLPPVLRFIGRHSENLTSLTVCLRPFDRQQCFLFGEQEDDGPPLHRRQQQQQQHPSSILSPEQVQSLYKLRLKTLDFTETRFSTNVALWKNILYGQDQLEDFKFEWRYMRGANFPWTILREPILKSSSNLVTVNLLNISMSARDIMMHSNSDSINSRNRNIEQCANIMSDNNEDDKIIPFDLSIFQECHKLKSLLIRVRKRSASENDANEDEDSTMRPLLINGSSLPVSLHFLELYNLPMTNDDLRSIIKKCSYLKKLIINCCGSRGQLGLTPVDIRAMSRELLFLENLEVENFNVSALGHKEELAVILKSIESVNEGDECHIILGQGKKIPAYLSLRALCNLNGC